MFKENLKQILKNLPLILSDSGNAEDVSLNRIIILISFLLTIVCTAMVFLFFPQLIQPLLPYFQAWLTWLGALISGNICKKVLNK